MKEWRQATMGHAFNAATVALWGLTDNHVAVLVGSDEIRKARKKQRETTLPSSDTSSPAEAKGNNG